MDHSCNTTKVKVRFKWRLLAHATFLIGFFCQIRGVAANRAPRFLIDDQTEIVLRLKEGSETPIGRRNISTCSIKDHPKYYFYV